MVVIVPSRFVDNCSSDKDIVLAFGLFVLLGHLPQDSNLRYSIV